MDRVEIHIAYDCCNRCLFCSEYDQLTKFKGKYLKRSEISRALFSLSKKGFSHVTLTGGEPTFHPDFKNIVSDAKDYGYRVYVSSNGSRLADKRFSKEVLPFIDEACISLHGHTGLLHNRHTSNPASFKRALSAMENIRKSKNTTLFINSVVTKYNMSYLDKIIALAGKYNSGAGHVLLSHIAPEGAGLRRYKELAVSQKKFSKNLSVLAAAAQRYGFSLRVFGMPLCYYRGYYVFSNDIYWSPRLTIELWKYNGKIRLKRTVSEKPTRNRVTMPRCILCSERNLCGGVFKKHYDVYGDEGSDNERR
jgi:MoaA/NifB/PqqE/SkfB family radical SAM enzyme